MVLFHLVPAVLLTLETSEVSAILVFATKTTQSRPEVFLWGSTCLYGFSKGVPPQEATGTWCWILRLIHSKLDALIQFTTIVHHQMVKWIHDNIFQCYICYIILSAKSSLRNCLDTQLLRRHNLIVPEDFSSEEVSPAKAPQGQSKSILRPNLHTGYL